MSVVSNLPLEEHLLALCSPQACLAQPWPLSSPSPGSYCITWAPCSMHAKCFPWPWLGNYSDFVYVPSSCMQWLPNHSPIIPILLILQTTPRLLLPLFVYFDEAFPEWAAHTFIRPLTTLPKFFASSCLLASFHIYSGWRSDYWSFLLSDSSWSWVSIIERSYVISILFPG